MCHRNYENSFSVRRNLNFGKGKTLKFNPVDGSDERIFGAMHQKSIERKLKIFHGTKLIYVKGDKYVRVKRKNNN